MKSHSAFVPLSVGGGHNAFSCDVIEPSGEHPEWHILGDALDVINPKPDKISFRTMNNKNYIVDKWNLIIAHPPCTYLSNAGACRLYPKKGQLNQERYTKGLQAKEFFMQFINANCEHIAVENPIPSKIYNLPKYTQIIQPYQFGHPYTKKTCLWLKGLPKLQPTNVVEPQGMWVNGNSNIWKKQAADGNVTGKSKDPRVRAKTFEGIAAAMADQWGTFLENHKI